MQPVYLVYSNGDVTPCRNIYHAQELQAINGGEIVEYRRGRLSMLAESIAWLIAFCAAAGCIVFAIRIFLGF